MINQRFLALTISNLLIDSRLASDECSMTRGNDKMLFCLLWMFSPLVCFHSVYTFFRKFNLDKLSSPKQGMYCNLAGRAPCRGVSLTPCSIICMKVMKEIWKPSRLPIH